MKFKELAYSFMSLYAVQFFVWAAHKNFAVLVWGCWDKLPWEGEGGGKLQDGEVVVPGAAFIGGVVQPGAGGDGDLAVIGVSVVMLAHNNPDMENWLCAIRIYVWKRK